VCSVCLLLSLSLCVCVCACVYVCVCVCVCVDRLQLITCHVPGPCISHCLTCIHAFALHTLLSVVQKITPEEAVKEGAGDKP